jgi:hypothetical protein
VGCEIDVVKRGEKPERGHAGWAQSDIVAAEKENFSDLFVSRGLYLTLAKALD